MEIRREQQLIENGTKQAIIEFEFERCADGLACITG